MCKCTIEPPLEPTTHPIAIYKRQLSVSRCVVEFGYGFASSATDRNEDSLLCNTCKNKFVLLAGLNRKFKPILRHYINIGQNRRERFCYYCSRGLSIWQEINDCDACSEAFIAFLEYLREDGRDFDSLTDPAFIDVDEDVGRHNLIFSKRLSFFLHSLHIQRSTDYGR